MLSTSTLNNSSSNKLRKRKPSSNPKNLFGLRNLQILLNLELEAGNGKHEVEKGNKKNRELKSEGRVGD